MRMFAVCLLFYTTQIFAGDMHPLKGTLEIKVTLSPAGEFTIRSNEIRGKGKKTEDGLEAKFLEVPVQSLDSGIELRNHHMWKRLEGETGGHKRIFVKEAKCQKNKGTGTIIVAGHSKNFEFECNVISDHQIEAHFKLSMESFGIKDASYMGVGADDEVELTVNVKEST